MIIYMAGNAALLHREIALLSISGARLVSYGHQPSLQLVKQAKEASPDLKLRGLFLDSGAFSAWSMGMPINIDEYMDYIDENSKHITQYSVLDVIGDAEGTYKNQKIMEEEGFTPLPCFHFGEDVKYLKRYSEEYEHFTIGGMVGRSKKDLYQFLNQVFGTICDKDGMPKNRLHGFGVTSIDIIKQFPWYSVDSTSWNVAARTGIIYVPNRLPDGTWDYLEKIPGKRVRKVQIMRPNPKLVLNDPMHFLCSSSEQQKDVLDWLEYCNVPLGKSSFKDVKEGYELQENEQFAKTEINPNTKRKMRPSKTKVEVIEEAGVVNNYFYREQCTTHFFRNMEDAFEPFPYKWKRPNLPTFFGA